MREETHISHRTTYSRQINQHDGRHRDSDYTRLERLETENVCNPPIDYRLSSRPVRISSVSPTRSVCQPETQSPGTSHRCLHNELVQHNSVRPPSVQPHSCSPTQNESRGSNPDLTSSPVVSPTLVAPIDRDADQLPSLPGERPRTPDGYVDGVDMSREKVYNGCIRHQIHAPIP